MQHRATVEGQLLRCNETCRPFVLSRAFFAGSQRHGNLSIDSDTVDHCTETIVRKHVSETLEQVVSLFVLFLSDDKD